LYKWFGYHWSIITFILQVNIITHNDGLVVHHIKTSSQAPNFFKTHCLIMGAKGFVTTWAIAQIELDVTLAYRWRNC